MPLKSYYRSETGKEAASPFKKKSAPRRARRFLFGFLDIILVIVLISGLLYSLLVSSKPKIVLSSTAYHDVSNYQREAERLFSSFKNQSKITFDQNSIAQGMRARFPEIASVDTELPVFSQKATLRLGIAPPSLILKSGNSNYIVDAQGVIVQRISNPSSKKLPVVEDKSGYEAKIGKPVLNADAVNFVKTLDAELRRAKVDISGYSIPPVAQEIDLNVNGQNYYAKFYLGGDVLTQAGQYLAARANFNALNTPSQYIDVRVPGKIFYK